jgi:hypothetical protein
MSRVVGFSYRFTQSTDISVAYIAAPAGGILLGLPHEEVSFPLGFRLLWFKIEPITANITAALIMFLLLPATITLTTH